MVPPCFARASRQRASMGQCHTTGRACWQLIHALYRAHPMRLGKVYFGAPAPGGSHQPPPLCMVPPVALLSASVCASITDMLFLCNLHNLYHSRSASVNPTNSGYPPITNVYSCKMLEKRVGGGTSVYQPLVCVNAMHGGTAPSVDVPVVEALK